MDTQKNGWVWLLHTNVGVAYQQSSSKSGGVGHSAVASVP